MQPYNINHEKAIIVFRQTSVGNSIDDLSFQETKWNNEIISIDIKLLHCYGKWSLMETKVLGQKCKSNMGTFY